MRRSKDGDSHGGEVEIDVGGLAAIRGEVRALVYGAAGRPEWGTGFVERALYAPCRFPEAAWITMILDDLLSLKNFRPDVGVRSMGEVLKANSHGIRNVLFRRIECRGRRA